MELEVKAGKGSLRDQPRAVCTLIFSCMQWGAMESIGEVKRWDQICTFESLLQLHDRGRFGGAGLGAKAFMGENPEQRPEAGSLAWREANPGGHTQRLILPHTSCFWEKQEAGEVSGWAHNGPRGERKEVQGHREESKGQGLCKTFVQAHLGPNLPMAITSNLF